MSEAAGSGGRLFTAEMRSSTRSVHDASDKLVNLKLGLSLSDSAVWYEGLLVFEPVFRFLESALDRHKDSLLGELDIEGMRRTEALKKDLDHFYGEKSDWKTDSESRPAVKKYIDHLKEVEDENPYLLTSYIYHLYMGLLSGGQILSKKRSFFGSKQKNGEPGNATTEFGPDLPIGTLKKRLREATNRIAEDFDEATRQAVLAEGEKVFQLNIEIIRSISGVDEIFRRKMLIFFSISAVVTAIILYLVFGRSS